LPESSTQVVQYLSTFIAQARSLTIFGVIILLVSAILMLRNVEKALNDIWRNRANRRPLQSFLLYWAVLSLGPIAIGLGLGVRAYLFAQRPMTGGIFDLFGLGSVLIGLLPFNQRYWSDLSVCRGAQLPGALPPCPDWRDLRCEHLYHRKNAVHCVMAQSSYTLVYGAFAAVPLFLLWIYVTWIIVLIGAVLTHSLSAYQTKSRRKRRL